MDDEGTDVFLSLVDLTGRPARPDIDTVSVHCRRTNRDLPFRLPFGNEAGDFEIEGVASHQANRGDLAQANCCNPPADWKGDAVALSDFAPFLELPLARE